MSVLLRQIASGLNYCTKCCFFSKMEDSAFTDSSFQKLGKLDGGLGRNGINSFKWWIQKNDLSQVAAQMAYWALCVIVCIKSTSLSSETRARVFQSDLLEFPWYHGLGSSRCMSWDSARPSEKIFAWKFVCHSDCCFKIIPNGIIRPKYTDILRTFYI
jgi:hypothetical protein